MRKFNQNSIAIAFAVALGFVLAGPMIASAATTPSLGTASTFGLLANLFQDSATTTITGVGSTLGALGYSSRAGAGGVITVINGTTENTTAVWTAAGIAQGAALTNLNNQYLNSCTNIGETGNLDAIVINGGTPGHFPPGCYFRAGAMNIVANGTVNLDGAGTYIFKSTGDAITTAASSTVALNNGASACDVFWIPVAATSLGATSVFKGTVLDAAGITIGNNVAWSGRALAYGGTVTSNVATGPNTINVPTCSNPASLTVTKIVNNHNGRTKVVSDFPLFAGTTSVISGILNNFAAAAYAITETNNVNYVQSFSGDCDANGNITLSAGGNYNCTITNNDVASPRPSGGTQTIFATTTVVTTVATTTPFIAPPHFFIPALPNTGLAPDNQMSVTSFFTYLGLLVLVSASTLLLLQKRKA